MKEGKREHVSGVKLFKLDEIGSNTNYIVVLFNLRRQNVVFIVSKIMRKTNTI